MSNSKRVVIISGGSRGLGQACVERLLNDDCIVATFSRSKTEFIEKNLSNTDSFFWRQLDINDRAAVKKYVLDVQQKFGCVNGLINNAGGTLDRLLAVTSDEEIDRTLLLNLESAIHLSRLVCRSMLCGDGGNIINISSILGCRGFKGVSVYSASKSALDGFSRSLARELGAKSIRVNSIAPGFLATDMTAEMPVARQKQIVRRTPLGRLGEVDDVTGLVRFLLSSEAAFITGQTFVVDGGLTC